MRGCARSYFPGAKLKTWRDLTPGALFGLSISGETHLGVKIQGSGGGFHCAVLTGFPPLISGLVWLKLQTSS